VDPILNFGIQLIQALQTLSPAFDQPMKALSFLGTIEFYLLLIPLIYWLVDAQLGMRVLLVLIGADFLGVAFKQLLRGPRPYWVGGVKALEQQTSYGIPSTHASDSLAVGGYLAYRLKKDWIWAIAILLVPLVGLSRLYLGVHFPQDVLGGWLVGLVVVVLFARLEARALSWLKKLPASRQIGLGFGISLLIILAGRLVAGLAASTPDPLAWASYGAAAGSMSHYFTLAGTLFGAVAGFVLMQARARFQAQGPWPRQAGRYAVGLLGLLAIYLVLDILFAQIARDETLAGYLLRYVRYASVAFWAIFGAPWVFLKLKLCETAIERGRSIVTEESMAALNLPKVSSKT
jgi:membrane-associated phospholipid phosphatase